MARVSTETSTSNEAFYTLLIKYPELEQWLANNVRQSAQLEEDDIHWLFLGQCAQYGITSEEYPFTADDFAEMAIRDYWLNYDDTQTSLQALKGDGSSKAPQAALSAIHTTPTSTGYENTGDDNDALLAPQPSLLSMRVPAVTIKRLPPIRSMGMLFLTLRLLFLLGLFTPTAITLGFGLSAFGTYEALHNQAHSALEHLLNVKTIFTGIKAHPTGFLDVTKLRRAQKEFVAADKDFQQLRFMLDHSAIIDSITLYAPQYVPQIRAARAASQIGRDVAAIGENLVTTALTIAPTFRDALPSGADGPLVTPSMLALVGQTIDTIMPRLDDIRMQTQMGSISALPINAQQRDQLRQFIEAVPQAEVDLTQLRALLGAGGWLLGVDAPRAFLVQTMDRGELRSTGGFTGQYGELQVDSGRVAAFSLRDISLLEYADHSPTLGQQAPSQYRSWWPFANWGLRDSNLSADFPTSARSAIEQYTHEVGHPVDGVVLFTPFLIEHVLQIIGPIQVPGYNETITAQNLEERLHYYQLDNAGIFKQVVTQPGVASTSDRKRFTSFLARLLTDRIRHAPPDEIIAIARQMLHDLKTKDLQVYVTSPQIESFLMQYGDAAELDRSTSHDGLYVVQTNIGANKASQYVQTSIHDAVTLDSAGGATHALQLRLAYNQLGPVYGYDTYRDYVRVYVPPTSEFLAGSGFDTGIPLCGGHYIACPLYNVYQHGELLCPVGQFQPGAGPPSITNPDGADWRPLDTIGPPTSSNSDEPGRAMFAGLVVVPKNCTLTMTLSWHVPPLAGSAYALLVQRQAGTFPELDLTILPTPSDCATLRTPGQHFDGILGEDMLFPLKTFRHAQADCYPQPGL